MSKHTSILIITAAFFSSLYCNIANAELVKSGVWEIQSGDTLDSVLATTMKGQPLRQKRLKRLMPRISPTAFNTNGELIVGKLLRVPGAKLPKTATQTNQNKPYAGRVLASTGIVYAQNTRGKYRRLKRGSAVNNGDKIITQKQQAQIRFTDGSLVALRANSEFLIEEYNFNGSQDGSEKSTYNLLKGSLRSLSGAIGKLNKENYRLKTPVATIGIRGTDFAVTYCAEGECGDLTPGLYCAVADGAIVAKADGEEYAYGKDNYFFIDSASKEAKTLLSDPGVLFLQPKQKNNDTKGKTSSSLNSVSYNKNKENKTNSEDDSPYKEKERYSEYDYTRKQLQAITETLENGGSISSKPSGFKELPSNTSIMYTIKTAGSTASAITVRKKTAGTDIIKVSERTVTGSQGSKVVRDLKKTYFGGSGINFDSNLSTPEETVGQYNANSLSELGLYWGTLTSSNGTPPTVGTQDTSGPVFYSMIDPESANIADLSNTATLGSFIAGSVPSNTSVTLEMQDTQAINRQGNALVQRTDDTNQLILDQSNGLTFNIHLKTVNPGAGGAGDGYYNIIGTISPSQLASTNINTSPLTNANGLTFQYVDGLDEANQITMTGAITSNFVQNINSPDVRGAVTHFVAENPTQNIGMRGLSVFK